MHWKFIAIIVIYEGKVKSFGLAYVKLGTSRRWVGTRTGAGVTARIKAFLVELQAPWASTAVYAQGEKF
jgi:hypothetical protein